MRALFFEQCGLTRDFWNIARVRLAAARHRGPALILEAAKT